MKRFLLPSLALVLALGAAPLRALTNEEAIAGRAVVKRYADSIISVNLVITLNITVGDRTMPPQEVRREVNGTVVSPSGLTVTALSLIDPRSATLDRLRANPAAAKSNIQMSDTQFKEVKLRLPDGTEIAARVVLKDADTDLAFIAPDPAAAAGRIFPSVDLQNAAEAQVLDTYFDVLRASRDLQRVPLVTATTVTGIVERPRRFFLVTAESAGTPIFDRAGAVLGLCVQHMNAGRPTGFVVLPSSQVAEIAKQAAVEAAKPAPDPGPAADDAKPAAAPAPAPAAP
jgi:S1-C subfamily serine protease